MYEYNGTDFTQTNQAENQTVPNVMMDDGQAYNGQVPEITVTTNEIRMDAMDPEVPQFDMPDMQMRRIFVRKLYFILMLQYLCALPVVEIFLLCFDGPIDGTIYFSFLTLRLILYALMYGFSEFRRHTPVNVMVLIVITLLQATGEGIYSKFIGDQTALFAPLVVVFQLMVLILYSKQTRFRFTNFNGMTFMLLIFVICSLIFQIFLPTYLIHASIASFFSACYFIYDTHLMLTGYHGYNLNQEEYIFAASNIYADFPYLMWRQFLNIIDGIVKKFNFLRSCCFSDVC